MPDKYQLAHYYSDDAAEEYVVIIDTDDDELRPYAFVRKGFLLQELVDLPGDLSGFPVGYELRRV